MEKNSDDSKQQYFSSNTNDDGKSSGVKLGWICCRMILEGFPVVNKRSAHTKNLMLKWREGSRKLRGTRDSTQKYDSFVSISFPQKAFLKSVLNSSPTY